MVQARTSSKRTRVSGRRNVAKKPAVIVDRRGRPARPESGQSMSAASALRLLALAAAALSFGTAAAQTVAAGYARPYRVECAPATAGAAAVCRVDLATYLGWRVFHTHCASCHAADALGSSFAPDLTQRLRGINARAFFAALDNGYLGPGDPMPPRGRNPDVARYYDELWTYLLARANGDLPPGTLERLPNVDFAVPD